MISNGQQHRSTCTCWVRCDWQLTESFIYNKKTICIVHSFVQSFFIHLKSVIAFIHFFISLFMFIFKVDAYALRRYNSAVIKDMQSARVLLLLHVWPAAPSQSVSQSVVSLLLLLLFISLVFYFFNILLATPLYRRLTSPAQKREKEILKNAVDRAQTVSAAVPVSTIFQLFCAIIYLSSRK